MGVGLDSESSLAVSGSQVHNSLLGSWYEAGLLGVLGFAALLMTVFACARRVANYARSLSEWVVAVTLAGSSFTWLLYGMGNPVLYKRYGWIAAVLVLSLRAQHLRRAKAKPINTIEPARSPSAAVQQPRVPAFGVTRRG